MGRKSLFELPPYVHTGRTRHGRIYYYYQRHRGTPKAGPYVRLPDDPKSPAFWSAYELASGQRHEVTTDAGTFARLIREYKASPQFAKLAETTKREYERYLLRIETILADVKVRELRPVHVLEMHDRMAGTPIAADAQISVLSTLVKWGIPRGYRDDNPAENIERFGQDGDGYKPWPDWGFDLIDRYARPDLARASVLGRYLGQRRSDVIKIARSDRMLVNLDGTPCHVVKVTQQKTGDTYLIPMHRELITLWDRWAEEDRERKVVSADGSDLIVLQANGRPFTPDTFGAAWGREMKKPWAKPIRQAGLTFHGHRKSAAVKLAEAGVDAEAGGKMIGMSAAMFRHYSKGASQLRMAVGALAKMEGAKDG